MCMHEHDRTHAISSPIYITQTTMAIKLKLYRVTEGDEERRWLNLHDHYDDYTLTEGETRPHYNIYTIAEICL